MAVDLGKQIGPLPLGAWVVVVGAGLGIAWYTRRNGEPTIVEDVGGTPGVGDGSVGGWTPTQPSDGGIDVAEPETNEQWAIKAINWLIANNYPPNVADSAIRKYLAGMKLSATEYAIVGQALVKFGSPPQPLPPGDEVQTPPPTNTPVPTQPKPLPTPTQPVPLPTRKFRYQIVQPWPSKMSTLWGISAKYYGSGREWTRIYNANRYGRTRADGKRGMIKNPNRLLPGWKLLIP